MRMIWSAFSFLAVVHLLALLMFVAWLWSSNRLNAERVQELRALLAPTIEEAQAMAAEREAEAAEEREQWEAEVRRLRPPVSSEVQLRQISRVEELELRSLNRIESERKMLREQFETAMSQLEDRERALEQQRQDWQDTIAEEAARRADEQFAQTVQQYESIPPKQGKGMIVQLVNEGEMKQAVAYLDAMNPRAASKILREFKVGAEIELATRLLEELRTFGVPAEVAQDLSNADAADESPRLSNADAAAP